MLARSDEFKNKIKTFGKEIDFRINLHINDRLITEDNKFIMTEDNMHLMVEQFNEEDIDETIDGEDIYNVAVVNKGNLLSTMMKEVDFEIEEELRIGDIVDCAFGLKVNDDYEYIEYGKYMIFSKEHNEDTNTFSYVAFDSMLLSMVIVDDTSIIQNVSVKKAIENICDKVGLSVNITNEDVQNLPNLNKIINDKTFTNVEMTYRDVLDMICQCLGISMIVNNKTLQLKYIDNTIVDEFDEEYLKDTNVTFGEKYGPINSVVLSRSEDNDTINRQDEQSIAENGLHEFKIKDNLIMLYDDRADYIDEIFNQLNGLEFYINDFSSTGITYLEWLDFYNIIIGDNTYKCLMLNDEIKLQQGLEESIYSEEPDETTTNYMTSGKTDKEVSFLVDKQNGKISARVTRDDMESYVEQTASSLQSQISDNAGNISTLEQTSSGLQSQITNNAGNISTLRQTTNSISQTVSNNNTKANIVAKINDNTSSVKIDADVIDLSANDILNIISGNAINLTSRNIVITSTKFSVTKDGDMTANSGTMGGWTINNEGLKNNDGFYIKNTGVSNVYTMSDILVMRLILAGVVTPQSGTAEFRHYDLNNDGVINSQDLLLLRQLLLAT